MTTPRGDGTPSCCSATRSSPSLYFGARLAAHPGRYLIGYGRDPQIFVWSFAWWLHALETLAEPVRQPCDLRAGRGQPRLGDDRPRARAPVHADHRALRPGASPTTSPRCSLPALAAFTAYLLCRHLTRSLWAALVGGYLFGFSSYMLGQQQGHLHMTAVFLLPLIALATIRYLQGELDGRGFAWRLGVLFGLQFWLSTELLVTAALALALGARPRLRAAPARRGRGSAQAWRPLARGGRDRARRRRAARLLRG